MKLSYFKAAEIWEQAPGFEGMCEHIARCSAVCYNSEPKTGENAVDFVRRLIKRGHGRPLEFGTLLIGTRNDNETKIEALRNEGSWACFITNSEKVIAVANLRSLVCNLGISFNDIEKLWADAEIPQEAKRYTVYYPAISRAIADEFRTHTSLSTLMQSTRYVTPANDDGIEFIKPYWYGSSTLLDETFEHSLKQAEQSYNDLFAINHSKQGARDVLPLCVKTEMVQCGFMHAWDNFLNLRLDGAAHPQARQVALTVKKALRLQTSCK